MKKIKCPHCNKETVYDVNNEYRPFCSERCKLIDLGAWAEEAYKVASEDPIKEEDLETLLTNPEQIDDEIIKH